MSRTKRTIGLLMSLILCAALAGVPMSGCEDLPGDRGTQGAVIGGATGAVLGAVIAKENRLLGALIGGALGAGGGYLIGAKTDWFEGDDDDDRDRERNRREVRKAVEKAQNDPATAEEARRADTADVNSDGFVTLDEVIAMENAGFSDSQMIKRLEATGQVFDLNASQERVLLDAGVSQKVVNRMREINKDQRERILKDANDREVDPVVSDG